MTRLYSVEVTIGTTAQIRTRLFAGGFNEAAMSALNLATTMSGGVGKKAQVTVQFGSETRTMHATRGQWGWVCSPSTPDGPSRSDGTAIVDTLRDEVARLRETVAVLRSELDHIEGMMQDGEL